VATEAVEAAAVEIDMLNAELVTQPQQIEECRRARGTFRATCSARRPGRLSGESCTPRARCGYDDSDDGATGRTQLRRVHFARPSSAHACAIGPSRTHIVALSRPAPAGRRRSSTEHVRGAEGACTIRRTIVPASVLNRWPGKSLALARHSSICCGWVTNSAFSMSISTRPPPRPQSPRR